MTQTQSPANDLMPRKIGLVNWIGVWTLVRREVGRFLRVYSQTIIAPVVTTLLFYTVFALAFGGITREIDGIPFLQFLAPGLIMMAMAQNAFANTSSSLIIGKIQGNIIDILMPPLSDIEIFLGFLVGGVLRGLCVGFVAIVFIGLFVTLPIYNAFYVVIFAVLGTVMMSIMGIMAGIWAEKFDHIAAFTNFFVTPLTFLSGTFYAIEALPEPWRTMALYNPFFYMIDGFRCGFTGLGEVYVLPGIAALVLANFVLGGVTFLMIRSGYKIKS